MSKRILIHGADPILLETRSRILSLNGFAVETVLNVSILADLIQSRRPDLLVVCFSLPSDSQQRDVRAANALRPKVKCLVVDPRIHNGTEIIEADAVFHAFDGPAMFITEVEKLVSPSSDQFSSATTL
ncbi:DNA-binding NtrC family response regulator [Granulicella aggregans]|uniref:DNA-binding NtrC family response regulator n=1 Tax=Granulicella aggregans TaxID=474949 RepID=A0A7W8E6P2_9BACT|nr:DNA-binding NtrC family response regulator [Granulicella aggregans]